MMTVHAVDKAKPFFTCAQRSEKNFQRMSCFDRIKGAYYNLSLLAKCQIDNYNGVYILVCFWNMNISNGPGWTQCTQTEERFETHEKAEEHMKIRMAKASAISMRGASRNVDDDFTPTEAEQQKNPKGIAAMIANGERFTMSLEEVPDHGRDSE
jgi:hypothetical protein